jgi:hypothetical protein
MSDTYPVKQKKLYKVSMENIPDELMMLILSFVDNTTLYKIGITESYMKYIIDDCIELRKINDQIIEQCFNCFRYSILRLPVNCTVLNRNGNISHTHICSVKCRRDRTYQEYPINNSDVYMTLQWIEK